jgi:hypothetical protein
MDLVVAAATLWALVSLGLVLPWLRASSALSRSAVVLLGAEFLSLLAWSYGTEECAGACPPGTSLSHTAAFRDIPALTVVLLAACALEGWRARSLMSTTIGASDDPSPQAHRRDPAPHRRG